MTIKVRQEPDSSCQERTIAGHFDARPEVRIGEWFLTWEFIERTLDTYAPDEEAVIVLDSTNPLEQNVAAAAAALRASRPSTPCDPRAAG